MKKAAGIVATAGLVIVLVVSLAQAQKKEASTGPMGKGCPGMMGQSCMMGGSTMMGSGMMGMPCHMMGVVMGGQAVDSKLQGEMMVLRGEMMKKMAEMMAKRGEGMIKQGKEQAKKAGK